ncbi:unnamed protein product [Pedinophyceae sp. YPF-701]|nr:unnamed protein product [Pedinophyceae sp. YPF-701]
MSGRGDEMKEEDRPVFRGRLHQLKSLRPGAEDAMSHSPQEPNTRGGLFMDVGFALAAPRRRAPAASRGPATRPDTTPEFATEPSVGLTPLGRPRRPLTATRRGRGAVPGGQDGGAADGDARWASGERHGPARGGAAPAQYALPVAAPADVGASSDEGSDVGGAGAPRVSGNDEATAVATRAQRVAAQNAVARGDAGRAAEPSGAGSPAGPGAGSERARDGPATPPPDTAGGVSGARGGAGAKPRVPEAAAGVAGVREREERGAAQRESDDKGAVGSPANAAQGASVRPSEAAAPRAHPQGAVGAAHAAPDVSTALSPLPEQGESPRASMPQSVHPPDRQRVSNAADDEDDADSPLQPTSSAVPAELHVRLAQAREKDQAARESRSGSEDGALKRGSGRETRRSGNSDGSGRQGGDSHRGSLGTPPRHSAAGSSRGSHDARAGGATNSDSDGGAAPRTPQRAAQRPARPSSVSVLARPTQSAAESQPSPAVSTGRPPRPRPPPLRESPPAEPQWPPQWPPSSPSLPSTPESSSSESPSAGSSDASSSEEDAPPPAPAAPAADTPWGVRVVGGGPRPGALPPRRPESAALRGRVIRSDAQAGASQPERPATAPANDGAPSPATTTNLPGRRLVAPPARAYRRDSDKPAAPARAPSQPREESATEAPQPIPPPPPRPRPPRAPAPAASSDAGPDAQKPPPAAGAAPLSSPPPQERSAGRDLSGLPWELRQLLGAAGKPMPEAGAKPRAPQAPAPRNPHAPGNVAAPWDAGRALGSSSAPVRPPPGPEIVPAASAGRDRQEEPPERLRPRPPDAYKPSDAIRAKLAALEAEDPSSSDSDGDSSGRGSTSLAGLWGVFDVAAARMKAKLADRVPQRPPGDVYGPERPPPPTTAPPPPPQQPVRGDSYRGAFPASGPPDLTQDAGLEAQPSRGGETRVEVWSNDFESTSGSESPSAGGSDAESSASEPASAAAAGERQSRALAREESSGPSRRIERGASLPVSSCPRSSIKSELSSNYSDESDRSGHSDPVPPVGLVVPAVGTSGFVPPPPEPVADAHVPSESPEKVADPGPAWLGESERADDRGGVPGAEKAAVGPATAARKLRFADEAGAAGGAAEEAAEVDPQRVSAGADEAEQQAARDERGGQAASADEAESAAPDAARAPAGDAEQRAPGAGDETSAPVLDTDRREEPPRAAGVRRREASPEIEPVGAPKPKAAKPRRDRTAGATARLRSMAWRDLDGCPMTGRGINCLSRGSSMVYATGPAPNGSLAAAVLDCATGAWKTMQQPQRGGPGAVPARFGAGLVGLAASEESGALLLLIGGGEEARGLPVGRERFLVQVQSSGGGMLGCKYLTATTSEMPEPRRGLAAVPHKDAGGRGGVFLHGGYREDGFVMSDTWILWTDKLEWERVRPAKGKEPALADHCAFRMVRRPWLFGGVGHRGRAMNKLWSLDATRRAWTEQIQGGDIPSSRHSASCVTIESGALLYGGFDGSNVLGDLFHLCKSSLVWSRVTPPSESPRASFGHAACWLGGSMLAIGGVRAPKDAPDDDELGARLLGPRTPRPRLKIPKGGLTTMAPVMVGFSQVPDSDLEPQIRWARVYRGRRGREVIQGATAKAYIPSADDLNCLLEVSVSWPGALSLAESVQSDMPVAADPDVAEVIKELLATRWAEFSVDIITRSGRVPCYLLLNPDTIKVVGDEGVILKSRFHPSFRAHLPVSDPANIVLQLRPGVAMAFRCAPADRDIIALVARAFWAETSEAWVAVV